MRTMPHEKIRRKGGVRTAWLSRSYGAAASIMLAIGAGLTLVNLLWRPAPEIIHTLYSGNQSTEQVALPDGSTLWLGANSSCRYAADFSGRERRVELNGQGFDIVPAGYRKYGIKALKIEDCEPFLAFGFVAAENASLSAEAEQYLGKLKTYLQ